MPTFSSFDIAYPPRSGVKSNLGLVTQQFVQQQQQQTQKQKQLLARASHEGLAVDAHGQPMMLFELFVRLERGTILSAPVPQDRYKFTSERHPSVAYPSTASWTVLGCPLGSTVQCS